MNKKHIVTSIGVVFLATGIIGGIWSGISVMPKLINNAQILQAKYNEKEILYNAELNLEKLNINSSISNIVIKKHNKENILVERTGNRRLSTISAKSENNELVIKEEERNITKETKNVDDIVKHFIDEIYGSAFSNESTVTVYLPKKVDADVLTQNGYLSVEDDILSDTLNFETNYGYILLNSDLKLKNLNIKSNSDISLSTNEIGGIENVKLLCNTARIHGENFIREDGKMPEIVEIKIDNTYDDAHSVMIEANSPVAKNLIIDSASRVDVRLPILEYKFNFDIKAKSAVEFDNSDYEKYAGTAVEKYFKNIDKEQNITKEFIGLINEDLKDEPTEYNVKIKSVYTTFN